LTRQGNKPNLLSGIDPQGDIVWKRLTASHPWRMEISHPRSSFHCCGPIMRSFPGRERSPSVPKLLRRSRDDVTERSASAPYLALLASRRS
jgi:hypothetical protein